MTWCVYENNMTMVKRFACAVILISVHGRVCIEVARWVSAKERLVSAIEWIAGVVLMETAAKPSCEWLYKRLAVILKADQLVTQLHMLTVTAAPAAAPAAATSQAAEPADGTGSMKHDAQNKETPMIDTGTPAPARPPFLLSLTCAMATHRTAGLVAGLTARTLPAITFLVLLMQATGAFAWQESCMVCARAGTAS
jgi:hypothetical protein